MYSSNEFHRYSLTKESRELSIGDFRKTLLVFMILMIHVDAHFLRLTCRLFERAHALGGAGVLTATVVGIDILGERGTKTRLFCARSTGLVQSRAGKSVTTKTVLRSCSVLKGV